MRKSAALAAAFLLASCAGPDTPEMKPFELDHSVTAGSPADARFLLDAPAGRDGFITISNGRLATPDGKRFRIWGVNTSFSGSLPDKEDAPRYADLLARYGINAIRVHHCDRPWPRGLIDDSGGNTRKLHPEALDRLDFFIAELKKRGIYTNLNLNVSRPFLEGDGVKDADKIGYGKGLTYFDPVLIRLQKEYARQLLTHKNPYTGNEYRHEPAIVTVEMVNENSLVGSWVRGRLRGRQTTPTRATWTDIPPSYAADLDRLYRDWLHRRGLKPVPRLLPEQFAEASPERFRNEAAFYMHLERTYFEMMRDYLKNELGVESLLVGTSAHSGSLSPYPLLASTSVLDIVDGHTYWQHPRYKRDPETNKIVSWTIPNTAMVNSPLRSTVQALARNAVAGKPYTVSEVNHPWPAEHAAEGIPILAAYGALQDWDGIYLYSFSHFPPHQWEPGNTSFFDIRNDPVKMYQMIAGALIFLRGDVAPARQTVERSYTREQVIESLRLPSSEAPLFDPGLSPAAPLRHRLRIASLDAAEPSPPIEVSGDSPIRSDTGELTWWHSPEGDGVVAIDTPRSQGLIGYLRDRPVETSHLGVDIANRFAAITLHSLDGEPIARSSRLLLTTGGKTGTTGMVWNEKRTTLIERGRAPTTIETIIGRIEIRGLEGAASAVISPLDPAGRPAAELEMSCASGNCAADIDTEHAAPAFVISVNR